MKLVASAIVRNEADRYLEPWLTHLLTFCDEVRLIDDGSTDETLQIASAQYPQVRVMLHNPETTFLDDESAARNELLRWTIEGNPDYVLSIDADEFVADPAQLRAAVEAGPPVVALTMTEVWKVRVDSIGIRVDGQWGDRECPICWRAPSSPSSLRSPRWRIPARKLACGREPVEARRAKPRGDGGAILHFGWAREATREARAERYFEHDGGRYHANAHLQSLLDPDDKVQLVWRAWPEGLHDVGTTLWERVSA